MFYLDFYMFQNFAWPYNFLKLILKNTLFDNYFLETRTFSIQDRIFRSIHVFAFCSLHCSKQLNVTLVYWHILKVTPVLGKLKGKLRCKHRPQVIGIITYRKDELRQCKAILQNNLIFLFISWLNLNFFKYLCLCIQSLFTPPLTR